MVRAVACHDGCSSCSTFVLMASMVAEPSVGTGWSNGSRDDGDLHASGRRTAWCGRRRPWWSPTSTTSSAAVVEHACGPLLVLAGPGTGKTTTLVEAIVRRIEEGAHPDSILALTFSRKAAEQLRDRVAARVGRTMSASIGSTFHSFAYGLIRRYAPSELYLGPLRLLSAPEQDVVLRELLQDHPESVRWPDSLKAALGTRGFAREVHAVLSRAREKDLDGEALQRLGEDNGLPEFVAAGLFLEQYLTILDERAAVDYSDLIRRATIEATIHRRRAARAVRPRLRRRVPGHGLRPGRAAPGARRPGAQPRRGRRPAPVDLRVPWRRGARHPRLPDRVPARRRRRRPRWSRSGRRAASGRASSPPPSGSRSGSACPAASRSPRARRSSHRPPSSASTARAGSWCAPTTATAGRPSTSPTCCAGPTSRTASPGTRWRCWSAPGRAVDPAAAALARCRRRPGRGRQRRGAAGPRPGRAAAHRRPAGGAQPRQRRPGARRPHRRRAGRGAADRVRSAASTPATYADWPGSCDSARRRRRTPSPGCRPTRASWSAARCSTSPRSTG